jgi:hypothetical protein
MSRVVVIARRLRLRFAERAVNRPWTRPASLRLDRALLAVERARRSRLKRRAA